MSKLDRYVSRCFFCDRECLSEGYALGDTGTIKEDWSNTYRGFRKIIGSIGNKMICDECVKDFKFILGI